MTLSRALVLGYHGCDQSIANGLVDGSLRPDPGSHKHHWLGPGVYFWEESPSRAQLWAEATQRQTGKIGNPAVVGAVINMGNCLNLIDAAHLELVTTAHDTYLKTCKAAGVDIPRNKGPNLDARFLDHAVFETLHRMRKDDGHPPFDTIRAFFIEGIPLYETAGLRTLDHIQICVTNVQQILGFFHVPNPKDFAYR